MPADVTYLFNLGSPYPSYRSYLLGDRTDDNFRSNDDFYQSSSNDESFFSIRTLKPCLKNNFTNTKNSTVTKNSIISQNSTISKSLDGQRKNNCKSKEKRVTFADTQGGILTFVKYVTEPSHTPPQCLLKHHCIATSKSSSNTNGNPKFVLQFEQPVANYFTFRQKLKAANVSLESISIVSLKCLKGTVKVKNIAYEKQVTIRISFDGWKSNKDVSCQYLGADYDPCDFDTFHFLIQLPANLSKESSIEFCVCYKCGCEEYWDNNGGKNYVIVPNINYFPSNSSNISSSNKSSPAQQSGVCCPSTYRELPTPEDSFLVDEGKPRRFY